MLLLGQESVLEGAGASSQTEPGQRSSVSRSISASLTLNFAVRRINSKSGCSGGFPFFPLISAFQIRFRSATPGSSRPSVVNWSLRVRLRNRSSSFVVSLAVRNQMVRSEEHTSELQSLRHLVCRLLLE